MSNQKHIDVVKALYTAFGTGDVPRLLDLVSDDITFELPELPNVPLEAVYHGKDGIRQFMADRAPVLTYTGFVPDKFLSDQDHVVVLGETSGIINRTGAPFHYKWVQVFEIDAENRIRRFQEFMDTHVLVSAFA
jgi:uncharacterized protein